MIFMRPKLFFYLAPLAIYFKNRHILWQNMHKINSLCFFCLQCDIALSLTLAAPISNASDAPDLPFD